jgi:hypothetical protein
MTRWRVLIARFKVFDSDVAFELEDCIRQFAQALRSGYFRGNFKMCNLIDIYL